MVNYVKDVEQLIDFHPEVTTHLINGPATLDARSLLDRMAETKVKVSEAEDLELHRMALIKERFGTVDKWLEFQEEQRKMKELQE